MSVLIHPDHIKACTALDLEYWSDSAVEWHVWAVDDNQTFHHLHVDYELGEVWDATTSTAARYSI